MAKAKEKILTEAELAYLLEVKTTVEQAKGVIKRNEAILRVLRDRDDATVKLPCPHCVTAGSKNGDYHCRTCAYTAVNPGYNGMVCLTYSFGGITHDGISSFFDLAADAIDVTACRMSRKEVRLATRWAKGHIEWAEEVIRRGKAKKEKKR
jgi:hypothetical protein